MSGLQLTVGIDLGQQKDPSAIAVVETIRERHLSGLAKPAQLRVRHLERMRRGLPYGHVVDRIRTLYEATWAVDPTLVIDASGVGAPVRDRLREVNVPLVAVTITGGHSETRTSKRGRHEDWTVSKSKLVQTLTGVVYSNRLRVAEGLGPAARAFQGELEDLQVHTSPAGMERVSVPESADHHADLAMAVALAAWRAEQPLPPKVRSFRADLFRR